MHTMQEVTTLVVEVLVEQGWQSCAGTAVAMKSYETAIGAKTALAYVAHNAADDPNRTLLGDYWSEGRNILSTSSQLLPKSASDEEVRVLARRFAKAVDAAVGESYGVRVLVL